MCIRDSFEVGARANIPVGASSTVPYLTASVGRRAMAARTTNEDGEQFDSAITGPMIGLGGGIEHFFSRSMALDAGIGVGYGKFNNVKFGEEEYDPKANATTSIRLRLGVNWWPALVTARQALSRSTTTLHNEAFHAYDHRRVTIPAYAAPNAACSHAAPL